MEENWTKIYEIEDYQKENEPIWLRQMLTDYNIPYNNKIEEYWLGLKTPKYKKRLKIFVPKEYEEKIKKYIEEFQNPKAIIKENIEELKDINDDEIDAEVKKYNKIRKIGCMLLIGFLIIVIIIGIICTIMTLTEK